MEKISELIILKNIIKEVAEKIRKQDFLTYFKKVSIIEINETSISLWFVSSFAKDNISHKFKLEIEEAVLKVLPEITKIKYSVDNNIDNPSNHKVIDCVQEYKEIFSKKKKGRKLRNK